MNTNLMTEEDLRQFPPLGAIDARNPSGAKVVAKFFTPDSSWTWYAIELDSKNNFFGLIDNGSKKELGYFTLIELQEFRDQSGQPVERDISFKNKTLADIPGWFGSKKESES